MDGEITAALIGGGLTVCTAFAAGFWAPMLRSRREAHLRAKEATNQYRTALVDAAHDLQSRIWNIVDKGFLTAYHCGRSEDDPERQYAESSTVWVVGQFFGWLEIMRREGAWTTLGASAHGERLLAAVREIRHEFASDKHDDDTFRMFRGTQRGLGEMMIVTRDLGSNGTRLDCIGYAEFLERREHTQFHGWFEKLCIDVGGCGNRMATDGSAPSRLVALQHQLIELIDLLDPGNARVARAERQRLPVTGPAEAPA